MPTATLHEVAKIAGVSKATVSRVINQSPRVAPAMAQAVHKAMESMVYQPPASRRGPKPLSRKGIRKGNLLLLLLGFPLSAGHRFNSYPAILDGIENCTRHNGLKLLMASIEDDTALPAALNAGEADGVLLFGDTAVLTPAARAKLQDLPVVGLMRGMDALRGLIDRISYNNAAVGPIAAQHLLGRGHRRLAFFNTDPRHPAFIQRRDDFAAAAVAAAPAGAPLLALVSRQRPPDFRQELLASEA